MTEEEEGEVFEVEKILAHDFAKDNTLLYKIRWKGYGPDADSWEPEGNLDGCRALLAEYWQEKKNDEKEVKQSEQKQKKKKKKTEQPDPADQRHCR